MKSSIILFVFLLIFFLHKQTEAKVIIRDLRLSSQDDLQSLVLDLEGEALFSIGKKGKVMTLKVFNAALEPDYVFESINSSIITGTLISEISPEIIEVKLLLAIENVGFGTRTLDDPFRIIVDLYAGGRVPTHEKGTNKNRVVENSGLKKVSPVQLEMRTSVRQSVNKAEASQHDGLKEISAAEKEQNKVGPSKKYPEKKVTSLSEAKKKQPDSLIKLSRATTSKPKKKDLYLQPAGQKKSEKKVETKSQDKEVHLKINKGVTVKLPEESREAQASGVKIEPINQRSWRALALEMTGDALPTPFPVDEDKFFNMLIEETPGEEGVELFMDGAIALKEGRKGEANIAFESLVKGFPDSILLGRVAFLRGLTILRNSDPPAEKGMRYLEKAARDYPDSVFAPLALLIVAQEYTKLKFYPEAMGRYKRIASQYPDGHYEAKILLGKGSFFKARRMFKRAEEQFKEAFKKAKDDDDKAMATFELSIMLTHLGKTLSALKLGEKAHENWPRLVQKYAEATLMLGENYMSTGAYGDARETFENLIVENPESNIASYLKIRIADSHLKEKKIAKAENGYSSLISESDDGMVFGKLALADLKINGPERKMAVKLYKDIERSFPDHKLTEFVLFKLGMVELEEKNYAEGFNILNDLVVRYPKGRLKSYVGRFIRRTLKKMINNLYKDKHYVEIIKTYAENKKWFAEELLLLKVAEAFVEVNLPGEAKNVLRGVRKGINKGNKLFWSGKVAYVSDDMEHAERQLLDYVDKFPNSQHYQEAQYLLGEIYYRNENYGDAVAQYSSIDLSDSSSSERDYRYVYLHAAKSFQEEGFFVKAAKYYRLAIKTTPLKDGDMEAAKFLTLAYSDLGSFYFSGGRYEDALQSYQKGLAVEEKLGIGDETPWFLFRIGECYEKLKKKFEAEQAFGKVKNLDSDLIGNLAGERLEGFGL